MPFSSKSNGEHHVITTESSKKGDWQSPFICPNNGFVTSVTTAMTVLEENNRAKDKVGLHSLSVKCSTTNKDKPVSELDPQFGESNLLNAKCPEGHYICGYRAKSQSKMLKGSGLIDLQFQCCQDNERTTKTEPLMKNKTNFGEKDQFYICPNNSRMVGVNAHSQSFTESKFYKNNTGLNGMKMMCKMN